MRRLQILPAILLVFPATISLGSPLSFGRPSAECKVKPGSSAPQGLHWYYRVDRTTHQHCWYLGAEGLRVRSTGGTWPTSIRRDELPNYSVEEAQDNRFQLAPEQLTSGANVASVVTIPVQISTDFVGRWPDLPQALDLSHRRPSSLANSYVPEQPLRDSRDQVPAMFLADADNAGVRDANSAAEREHTGHSYAERMLVSASLGLWILLLGGASLRFARRLDQRTPGWLKPAGFPSEEDFRWSARISNNDDRPTMAHPVYEIEVKPRGFSDILRRADAGANPPRTFAPLRPKVTHRGRVDELTQV